MSEYTTFVLCSDNAEAAQAARNLMFEHFAFGAKPTGMTACATGDAMSVTDAMRMALECCRLDSYEQRELALEMAECVNWDDCLKKAAEWDLVVDIGDFVDAPPASGIEAATAGETTQIGSTEGESPVGNAETPNLSTPSGDS